MNRYPEAVGSYVAQASHIATDVWNRFRAWTVGAGSARRIASRSASSQRRATVHSGFARAAVQATGCDDQGCHTATAPTSTATRARLASASDALFLGRVSRIVQPPVID